MERRERERKKNIYPSYEPTANLASTFTTHFLSAINWEIGLQSLREHQVCTRPEVHRARFKLTRGLTCNSSAHF